MCVYIYIERERERDSEREKERERSRMDLASKQSTSDCLQVATLKRKQKDAWSKTIWLVSAPWLQPSTIKDRLHMYPVEPRKSKTLSKDSNF